MAPRELQNPWFSFYLSFSFCSFSFFSRSALASSSSWFLINCSTSFCLRTLMTVFPFSLVRVAISTASKHTHVTGGTLGKQLNSPSSPWSPGSPRSQAWCCIRLTATLTAKNPSHPVTSYRTPTYVSFSPIPTSDSPVCHFPAKSTPTTCSSWPAISCNDQKEPHVVVGAPEGAVRVSNQ